VNELSFWVGPGEEHGALSKVPCIDGERLDVLVERFETSAGFNDPSGGYGGLVPGHHRFGPLDAYFRNEGGGGNPVPVLGCGCGEVGCWPLEACIQLNRGAYRWSDFSQPHRPSRDYSALGPFLFNAEQYEAALAALAAKT
jgi:hypothetical protein